MTTTTPESIESIATDSDLDADSVGEVIASMADELADLRETAEEQSARIEQLETELAETRQQAAKDRQRIQELESNAVDTDADGADPGCDVQETPLHEPETALEDVVQLPEPVAEDTLTANQQRARFVAKDIADYTRSVPAGRAIKSSEIRRVLTAAEKGSVHSQTVTRVMQFLGQLGEDSVNIRESRSGERIVVFEEDLVKRIVASNTVVTDNRDTTPQTV